MTTEVTIGPDFTAIAELLGRVRARRISRGDFDRGHAEDVGSPLTPVVVAMPSRRTRREPISKAS